MSAAPALLIPCSAADARDWAAGRLDDDDLIARADPLFPEAVYAARLYDLAGWRAGIVQARFWSDRGARLFITRTGNPVLLDHYARAGCVRTYQGPRETEGQWRLIAESDAFLSYMERWEHLRALRAVPALHGTIPQNSPQSAALTGT